MKALNYPILNNEFQRVGMMLQEEYSSPEIIEDLESGFPTFSVIVSKEKCEDVSKIEDNTYTKIEGEIYSLLQSKDIDRIEKELFYEHWAVPYLQSETESIEEPAEDEDAGFYFEQTLLDTPIMIGTVEVQTKKKLAFGAQKIGSRLHELYREFGVEPVFSTRYSPYDPNMPIGITLDLVQQRGTTETGIVLDSETNLIRINRDMNKEDLLTGIKVKPLIREETVKKTVKTAQQSVEIEGVPKSEQKTQKVKPAWPTTSGLNISSGYGPRRAPTAGASTWHAAIDIAGGGVNHPIYATQDGEVTTSHYDQYGNTIRIKHTSDKYYSQYMHLASRSVSVGQKVKRGQRIGTMGTTGISTGIHLDFAISTNGTFYRADTTIDPREYLKMEFTVGGSTSPADDDALPEKTRKQLAYFEMQEGGTYTQSSARSNYLDNQGRVLRKAPADCSSMVYKSLIFAGIPCGFSADNSWKGTTYTLKEQSDAGQYFNIVSGWSKLEPGDIILCKNWGHVVTYVGGGRVFHASQPGVPHLYANASNYKSSVNRILRPKDRGKRTIKKTQSTTQKIESTIIGGSNKDQIWVHLKNIGFGDIQAAAIMGNLFQESRYDPKAQQGGGRLPGRGIAQWSVNERWQDLLAYASGEGLDPWSIEAQVKFIHREMRYGYISSRMNSRASWYGGTSGAHGYEAFSTVNDITKATEFFCKEFEIAGEAMMSVRVNEAKKVYKEYKGTYQGGEESSVTVGDTKYTTKEISEKEEVVYSIEDIILEEEDFYSLQGQETIHSRKAQQRFGFNQQNKSYHLMGVHEMRSTNVAGEFESALLKLKEKSSPQEEYIVDLDTTDPDTKLALQSVELGDKIRVTSHGWERDDDLVLEARVSQVIRRPGEKENIGVRITEAERLEVFMPDHIRELQERIARANAEDFGRMQVILRSDIINFIGQGDETEITATVRSAEEDYTYRIPEHEFKWQVYDKRGIPISETEEHDIVIGDGIQGASGSTTWRTAELVDGNRYRLHPTIIGTEYRFDTYTVEGNIIDSSEWLDDREDVVYTAPPFASYMIVEAKTNPATRPFQVLSEATPIVMQGKKVFINADMVDERITVTCRVREAESSISLSKTDYTHTGPNPPSDYRPGSEFLREVPGTGIYDENGNWTGEFEKLMFDGHEWVSQDVPSLNYKMANEFSKFDQKLIERDERVNSILSGLGVDDLEETNQGILNYIQDNIKGRIETNEGILTQTITGPDGESTTFANAVQSNADFSRNTFVSLREDPAAIGGDYLDIFNSANLFRQTMGSTESDVITKISQIVQSPDIIQSIVAEIDISPYPGIIGSPMYEDEDGTYKTFPSRLSGGTASYNLNGTIIDGRMYYIQVTSTIQPYLFGVTDSNLETHQGEKIRPLTKVAGTTDTYEISFISTTSTLSRVYLYNDTTATGSIRLDLMYEIEPTAAKTVVTQLKDSYSIETQNIANETLASIGLIGSDGYIKADRLMIEADTHIAPGFKLTADHISGNIMELIQASFIAENGEVFIDPHQITIKNKDINYTMDLNYGRLAFLNSSGQEFSRLGIFSTDGGVTYRNALFQSRLGEVGFAGSASNGNAIGGFRVDKDGNTRFDGNLLHGIRFQGSEGRESGTIATVAGDEGHLLIQKMREINFRNGHFINSNPDDPNLNLIPNSSRNISAWGNINMNGYTVQNQSDMRLKKNIKPTKRKGIEWTKRQEVIDFTWDKDMKANKIMPEGEQFGIIAQNAGPVAKTTDEHNHYLAIKTDELAYMNLLTNQELIKRIEELEEQIG